MKQQCMFQVIEMSESMNRIRFSLEIVVAIFALRRLSYSVKDHRCQRCRIDHLENSSRLSKNT